ncbi:MAG: protease modulator HflC [bacterium]
MKTRNIIIGILVIIILIILLNGFYVIKETEQVVITMFEKPVGDPITKAGLHWKTPLIQKANFFEKRILTWDGDPNQIPTKDKKYIWVDVTARWKIVDPLKFLQSVTTETGAHSKLDNIVNSVIRDHVAENLLVEIIRSSNREFQSVALELNEDSVAAIEKIYVGRGKIVQKVLDEAKTSTPQFGIELVDVRLKRINYVEDVREKVYERMISERQRIAAKYRSEGKGRMAEIEGKRDKELEQIRSQAYKEAKEIKGVADAKATRIYAAAYNRDPDFYSFFKTLETYKETVDSSTIMILSTKSDYLELLNRIR